MEYDFQIAYYPDVRGLIEANANRTDGSTGRIYDIDLQNNYPNLIRVPEVILSHSGIALVKDASIHIPGCPGLKGHKIS